MNPFRAVCRSARHKAVCKVQQDEYTQGDHQIVTVNIDVINSNAKTPGIIAKLKANSYPMFKHLV